MRSVVVAFVLLIGVSANTSFACENWVAKVVSTNGLVEIKEGSQSKSAEIDSVVCPGQVMSVAANSRAALYLSNNSFVRLDQNTVLAFPKAPSDQGFWVQLQQGVSHFISRITQRFIVDAPYVNAAVDGTEFLVSAQGKESSVSVIEGQVTASNEGGQQVLTMGQKAVATGKASGFRLTPIQTEDVIDWAIYYSPLPVLQELQASDSAPVYKELIEQAQQQRPDLALQALQKQTITESLRVADAALRMSVGQAEKALAQIESSTSTQALALKSVIFSSRNQSEKALDYAQKAVQQDSQSSAALLALSYAHQAALNLPEALQAAHQATLLEENNAIAWARVSEMELAMGNIRQADKAIAHAQQKQPDSAYVITQAGFIKLFNIRIDSAKALFKQAIELDSENPQAHLGLGLALLRQGELIQGREQLEYATSLDPARSVVRSYLGRAYFEEKRDEEAGTQWALAKQLDPNDPTPYFYEGVRKLYANDPIGAIEELETSRKLNDERALYRSETLLQSDAASRSATLARAYDDVGYDQGVLLSGWDALKNDPTSSEGHRLLADYYRGNSRYETARASELLQSQLWQPLSAYPLQPQLSETGISVVEGSGPQNPGFNEYHSLFTQDGVYGSVTGYGGSDGTWGDDLVGSFLAGPVAVSLGQYHFETDGWRDNSDQEQDIYNGFVQWQATKQTNIQLGFNKFYWEKGYLEPLLGESAISFDRDEVERENSFFGGRHSFNSTSSVLFSLSRNKYLTHRDSDVENGGLPGTLDSESNNIEIQWIKALSDSNFILGFANYEEQASERLFSRFEVDLGFFVAGEESHFEETRESDTSKAYLYFFGDMSWGIDYVLGLSYFNSTIDSETQIRTVALIDGVVIDDQLEPVETTNPEVEDWLPKLAVGFELQSNLMVRAGYYEAFSQSRAVEKSIEPTTLAGFAQVYDDYEGVRSENFVAAVDYKERNTSVGMALESRNLQIPYDYSGTSVSYLSGSEEYVATYLTMFFSSAFSISIQPAYGERSIEDAEFTASSISEIDQSVFPIRLGLFNENAFSIEATQEFFHQRVRVLGEPERKNDSGWVTNISARYRFPGRLGSLSFGIENILNNEREVLSMGGENLAFYPSRFMYTSISLNL